jgi:hypothetical protein
MLWASYARHVYGDLRANLLEDYSRLIEAPVDDPRGFISVKGGAGLE